MKFILTIILEYIGMSILLYAVLHLQEKYQNYKHKKNLEEETKIPYLHVFGQSYPHDSVFLIGNREGLEQLQKRIEGILSNKKNKKLKDLYITDGEGFDLEVILEEKMLEKKVLRPYTDPVYQDKKGIHPYILLSSNLMKDVEEKLKVKTK